MHVFVVLSLDLHSNENTLAVSKPRKFTHFQFPGTKDTKVPRAHTHTPHHIMFYLPHYTVYNTSCTHTHTKITFLLFHPPSPPPLHFSSLSGAELEDSHSTRAPVRHQRQACSRRDHIHAGPAPARLPAPTPAGICPHMPGRDS